MLGEFARVLRPGGTLVFSTPNVNNVQSRYHYFASGHSSGVKTLMRRGRDGLQGPVHWRVRLDRVDVSMIKTRHWLLLPLGFPM